MTGASNGQINDASAPFSTSGGGITSINGDITAAQLITGGTGISVSTAGGDTVITATGGTGVTSLNGETGGITLTSTGGTITITEPSGSTINLEAGGGSSVSFQAITSGTNTAAAMVVGTGSFLAPSGSGAITATIAPAGTLTGTTLAAGVTLSSLNTVATITTGTWHGTKIEDAYGGTGADSSASTGVAQVSSGTWSWSTALANGTTATTQTSGDNSTKVATDAFVQTAVNASVTSFTGDGTIISNSLSTGAVTVTLANTPTGSGGVVLATAPTMTNPVVGTQSSSDNSTKAASTAYVTTAIANAVAGINPAVAVQAATIQASDTSGLTYNNGVSGIGATFTGSNNTALTIDGYTFTALGQRLLVKNDTQSPSGAFNGIYYVTQLQALALPPILTRALDYDQPSDINNTGAIPVINGTVNALTTWIETAQIVTVGTTPLVFVQFSYNPSSIVTTFNAGTTGFTPSSATSGAVTLAGTLGLANGGTNANLSATGGTHQFLKQSSSGAAITVGQPAFTDISGSATTAQLPTNQTLRSVTVGFDGGGSALTAGKIVYLAAVPYSGTITAVTLLADQSGSAVVDIWMTTYSGGPPTVANTITASDLPTLSSTQKNTDSTLTGWTTAVVAGNMFAFKLNSVSTITELSLVLSITAT